MALPELSGSLNNTVFAPGSAMTATIAYADADNRAGAVTITGVDSGGNAASVTLSFNIVDPVALSASDPERTWTKVSDNGSVAVFTATA